MSFLLHARLLVHLKSVVPLVLLAAIPVACDTAPGPTSLDNRPPLVSDLDYAPGVVDPGTGDGQVPVVDGSVVVSISVQVVAVDPDGQVADVLYTLESPGLGRRVVASGRMEPAGEGLYEASITLSLPVEQPGLYSLVVYATDSAGHLSNQVRGSVRLLASNTDTEVEGE